MHAKNWSATSAEALRSEVSDHRPRRQTVGVNGQGQTFHLSPSSACGDDPSISEEDVNSEHCKQV